MYIHVYYSLSHTHTLSLSLSLSPSLPPQELIPIMLCVLSRHPESKVREQLLHLMYNLSKKPDRNQRLGILSGCVGFAKLAGQSSLESELLPQLWEQVRENGKGLGEEREGEWW